MPTPITDDVPNPQALATVTAGTAEPLKPYKVVLKQLTGAKLGIDVTYNSAASWTKNGVFVARILEEGLVGDWNEVQEESTWVRPGDFIFQVNSVHGDTVSMIQEMKVALKSKPSLILHLVRRTPAAPLSAKPAKPDEIARTGAPRPKVNELLQELKKLNVKAIAGLILVALEKRPSIRDAVLDQIFEDELEVQAPPASQVPDVPQGFWRGPHDQPPSAAASATVHAAGGSKGGDEQEFGVYGAPARDEDPDLGMGGKVSATSHEEKREGAAGSELAPAVAGRSDEPSFPLGEAAFQ